ncbi:MAG: hypothetical protein LBI17_04010 [Rickettsiales bacterium]|jgi:hypothetical protein|nr:hypothetical protein [Rickettsiales bacterium]
MLETVLGFFYVHSKKLLTLWLAIAVSAAFLSSFARELDVFRQFRFAMNPFEIMFIGVINAVFMAIRLFVPALLAVVVLKYLIIKWKKSSIDRLFRPSFRRQLVISLALSLIFAGVFYVDVSLLAGYSRQLVSSSLDIFSLFFASILFTISSMYGLVRGFSSIVSRGRK